MMMLVGRISSFCSTHEDFAVEDWGTQIGGRWLQPAVTHYTTESIQLDLSCVEYNVNASATSISIHQTAHIHGNSSRIDHHRFVLTNRTDSRGQWVFSTSDGRLPKKWRLRCVLPGALIWTGEENTYGFIWARDGDEYEKKYARPIRQYFDDIGYSSKFQKLTDSPCKSARDSPSRTPHNSEDPSP